MMKQFLLIFPSMQGLVLETIAMNWLIILLIMTYASIFFCTYVVNIWNSLPNSIVDACTVNAFKARIDNFWSQQAVKYDFRADLTGSETDQKML